MLVAARGATASLFLGTTSFAGLTGVGAIIDLLQGGFLCLLLLDAFFDGLDGGKEG